ncbi:mannose-1-phosphate guanylyltransferase [Nematocida sp. AWRm77]|nr:mannose-1-phosphate guanylyltransferase [Nematocida sp. AWRm77]
MKGIILVGGFGTRLKPLTLTKPKPLVPFANKPIIKHQMEALARAGVSEIILAVGHMQEQLKEAFQGYEEELGVTITYSVETLPMGTAGPLSLLRAKLERETEPFFVLNSDVICHFPFEAMKEFHFQHGGCGTILATQVEEPSRYGVIVTNAEQRIERFVEKPEVFVGNRINAGIYLFNADIIQYIEDRPMSIEKEVLPEMIKKAVVKTFDLDGFWMDIGQPKDYLLGHALFLQAHSTPEKERSSPEPLCLVDPTAAVAPSAQLGECVVIGPRVVVEDGAVIKNAVIFEGAVIGKNAYVADSIVGWGARISSEACIEGYAVIGANAHIEEKVSISKDTVLPNTVVSLSTLNPPTPSPLLSPSKLRSPQ